MSAARESTARKARIVVADTARSLRARLRASRRYVSPQLDEYASRKRGSRTADGLLLFAAWALEASTDAESAAQLVAEMGQRIVAEVARDRAG